MNPTAPPTLPRRWSTPLRRVDVVLPPLPNLSSFKCPVRSGNGVISGDRRNHPGTKEPAAANDDAAVPIAVQQQSTPIRPSSMQSTSANNSSTATSFSQAPISSQHHPFTSIPNEDASDKGHSRSSKDWREVARLARLARLRGKQESEDSSACSSSSPIKASSIPPPQEPQRKSFTIRPPPPPPPPPSSSSFASKTKNECEHLRKEESEQKKINSSSSSASQQKNNKPPPPPPPRKTKEQDENVGREETTPSPLAPSRKDMNKPSTPSKQKSSNIDFEGSENRPVNIPNSEKAPTTPLKSPQAKPLQAPPTSVKKPPKPFAALIRDKRTDFYTLLEISPQADQKTITKAFRAFCKSTHPDHNHNAPTANEDFQALQFIYQVLSTPASRLAYNCKLKFTTVKR